MPLVNTFPMLGTTFRSLRCPLTRSAVDMRTITVITLMNLCLCHCSCWGTCHAIGGLEVFGLEEISRLLFCGGFREGLLGHLYGATDVFVGGEVALGHNGDFGLACDE